MKRLVVTVTGTVAGLAALLSFKTETHPLANSGALPSAASLPSAVTATASATTSAATASAAPSAATASATSSSSASSGTVGSASVSGSARAKAGSRTATSRASSSSPSAINSTPKTYTGQAITTRYGIVQIKVTVAKDKITDVAFTQLTAFDGRSQQINSAAAPQLLHQTLATQSARVDTVSGASYTSEGYRESLQSALDKAGLK